MGELADAIIFLCLTLLAIVIAIFILAVSFLGRALEQARKEREEAAELGKKQANELARHLDEIIAEVQIKLKGTEAAEAISALEKELEQYKKQKKESKKQLKRAVSRYKRYMLLTVPRGVLPTSLLLLVSFSLAAMAKLFTTPVSYAPLVVSLLVLGWACLRIYLSLLTVQEVAVTTEEAQFSRETEALETALEIHEAKKRPELKLNLIAPPLPFRFKQSTEVIINFWVELIKGDVGKAMEVYFFADTGFEFPGRKIFYQKPGTRKPGTLTTMIDMGDIKRGISHPLDLKIKTPSEAGQFSLEFRIICEGFSGDIEEFPIEIIE